MRLSTLQFHSQALAGMRDNQLRLVRTQQELATGRRLLSAADDPTGAEQVLGLEDLRARLEQYQRNANAARTRLEFEEGVLAQAAATLQRVRELAVRGLNDTVGASERAGIALEVRQRLADLLALANSKDAHGNWLFAGYYRGAAEPFADAGSGNYTYAGDEGRRLIQIGATRQVDDGDPGTEVFMRIPTGGGVRSVFEIVARLAADLEANAPDASALAELDAALERLGQVRARVGARLNALEDQTAAHEDLVLDLTQTLSRLRDLDYAEAVARLNRELLALQAAQQVYARLARLSLFDVL